MVQEDSRATPLLRTLGACRQRLDDNPDEAIQAALDEYRDVADDLHAGREPRERSTGPSVADLCNHFLATKEDLLNTSEITRKTFQDYLKCCQRLVKVFGRHRLVADLTVDDFAGLRKVLSKNRGPVTVSNDIGRIRVVFNHGYDAGLLDQPMRYGPGFKKPSRKTLRKARQNKGERMFEAHELRQILDVLDGKPVTVDGPDGEAVEVTMKRDTILRAMVLLAANSAFGQTAVASLPQSAVDLDSGWIDYPRPKTGVPRRCPMWPETIEALRTALAARPTPKGEADADLCFLTKYGNRWVRTSDNGASLDAVAQAFRKVLDKLNINGSRAFYALRHGFRTIADEAKDLPAIDHIMGHVREDMASVYRERISDERLQSVTDLVRRWLWPEDRDGSSN
jgi:integrase